MREGVRAFRFPAALVLAAGMIGFGAGELAWAAAGDTAIRAVAWCIS